MAAAGVRGGDQLTVRTITAGPSVAARAVECRLPAPQLAVGCSTGRRAAIRVAATW